MADQVLVKYTADHSLQQPVQRCDMMKLMLLEHESQIVEIMPEWSGVSWKRIMMTAIEAASQNKAILRCTGTSIIQSVKDACEFGLSFSKVLNYAYLVPFGTECTLIIGYRGLRDLARRAADVTSFECGAVYEGEHFEVRKGTDPFLAHNPIVTNVNRSDEKLLYVYSVAQHANGKASIDVMDRSEVQKIRQMSKQASGAIWNKHFRAMAVKTVIRRHIKLLPISAEKAKVLERALEHDNETAGISPNGKPEIDGADRYKALQSRLAGETAQESPEPEIIDVEPVEAAQRPAEAAEPAPIAPPTARCGGCQTMCPPEMLKEVDGWSLCPECAKAGPPTAGPPADPTPPPAFDGGVLDDDEPPAHVTGDVS